MTRPPRSRPCPSPAGCPSAPRATTDRAPLAAPGAACASASSPSDPCRRRVAGTPGSRDISAGHRRDSGGGCISLRACHHRVNDFRITRTAAQIPGEPLPHLVRAQAYGALEESVSRQQHARRADPALRRAVLDERVLQGRQPATISQSLDRRDLAALDLAYRYQATVHDLAIDQHGAGAALTFAAPFFGAGRSEVFAQHIEQAPRSRTLERHGAAVQREAHAASTFSGVAGISSSHTPVASWIAAMMAGAGPSMGSSPMPLAPNGPREYGFSTRMVRIRGASSAVGMR